MIDMKRNTFIAKLSLENAEVKLSWADMEFILNVPTHIIIILVI